MGEGVFVNLSNHPHAGWAQAQKDAASRISATIVDVPLPHVPAEADEGRIRELALQIVSTLPSEVSVAMVMGEYTLTVALVGALQRRGVRCVAATSVREVEEHGDDRKTSRFVFVRFRDYPTFNEEWAWRG